MASSRGYDTRGIATSLFMSPKTVEHHLSSIYRKMDIRSRHELSAVIIDYLVGRLPAPTTADF
jgi:DNA-binding NarL/FixJ family response regulator